MASDGTIKAFAVMEAKGQLKPFSYKARPLGEQDIEIKIAYCGVCGSDLHQINCGWGNSNYPMVVGHEIVGSVSAIGSSVKKFKVGQRVGLGAQCFSCGKKDCSACSNGLENCCPKSVFTYNGKYEDGATSYGGYAQYVRAEEQFIFGIPDGLESVACAPLMCAGITTFAPLYRANIKGKKVGIIGIGGLGHLGVQWSKALGAKEIFAISHNDKKKGDADKLGATAFIDTSDEASRKQYAGQLDYILCTANAKGQSWAEYIKLLNVFGQINLVAVPEEEVSIVPFLLCGRHVSFSGSLLGSISEIEKMLETAVKHNVKAWTELLPLEQCNVAIDRLSKNDVRYRFVLDCGNHKF